MDGLDVNMKELALDRVIWESQVTAEKFEVDDGESMDIDAY